MPFHIVSLSLFYLKPLWMDNGWMNNDWMDGSKKE
jgi:hypothetical protein